jgi:molybdopterin synthase sulfur carrier subunit
VQISIRYFTTLREITDKKEEKLTFPKNQKPTISLTLKMLANKYGKPFTDYVFDTEGEVKRHLQLFINGTNTTILNMHETPLQEGDILAILPPVSGG